jgi:hypothetical protein
MTTTSQNTAYDASDLIEPIRTKPVANAFAGLVALVGLITLFQGAMAGVFVRDDKERDARSAFIDAHAWGAHIGTVLAVALAALAVWKLREHRAVVVASVLLALSFLGESYIGGLIRDQDAQALTPVHVPLGMAILGLTAFLAIKASKLRSGMLERSIVLR